MKTGLFKKMNKSLRRYTVMRRFLLKAIMPKLRLFFGIVMNVLYIIWNTALAFYYKDSLLFAVSLYYIFLVLMRYALLLGGRRMNFTAEGTSLAIGILLIPTVLSMAGVMFSTLIRGEKRNYSDFTIIPQSLFVVFCLIGAIMRISRHENTDGKEALSLDVISLAAAFFSVFNLVNYLSHIGTPHIDGALTLAIGLVAVITVFVSAVFLIKSSYVKEG